LRQLLRVFTNLPLLLPPPLLLALSHDQIRHACPFARNGIATSRRRVDGDGDQGVRRKGFVNHASVKGEQKRLTSASGAAAAGAAAAGAAAAGAAAAGAVAAAAKA